MSVRNAGNTIREARIKAGLTQEQLSDGVCSLLSLSRIERGTAGVSPSTFQALMAHAGAPCEIFPVFENWNDYECFFHLRHARFHLDAWQLQPAWEELKKVKETEWNHNKYNYQEWLLLHGMLQFRSGKGNHQELYDLFLNAIHISRPDIVLTNFKDLLLSIPEIELLLSLAQEALYLNEAELCVSICSQIQDYLSNSQITFLEKNFLLAEHAVIYTKYLISKEAYECAYQLADTNRHQMVVDGKDSLLFELTFLTGLCEYHLGKHSDALEHFKSSFYSAHAVSSPYATTCRNYMQKHLKLDLPKNMVELPDIPLQKFKMEKIIDTSIFSDGVYSYYNADVITIGRLIHELRIRQNVSQQILCQGLCSISKLSKIESGTLQPSVILSETLLQRLGVSEREFVFWGNAKEAKFYELKFKLLHRLYISKEKGINMLNELQHLITEKDILYKRGRKKSCVFRK